MSLSIQLLYQNNAERQHLLYVTIIRQEKYMNII